MRLGRTAPRIALILAVAAGVVACGKSSVSMPPDSAPPDVVLDTFLQAQVSGDCTTARSLSLGSPALPCDGSIRAFTFDHGQAHTQSDLSVQYRVTLDVTIDFGMTAGEHGFTYRLQKQPSGAWRVISGSDGP
jgi:hypothetical protein